MERRAQHTRPLAARAGARVGLLAGVLLLSAAGASTGCYAPQLALLKSGLDSLRTQVDTLTVRDQVSYRVLADTRDDVARQRELMLSTKASVTSSTQDMNDLLSRLDAKLDEAMHLWKVKSERSGGGSSPPVVNVPPATAPATTPATTPVTTPATTPAITPATTPATAPVTPPPAATGPDPVQLYDQATLDLTQGRYGLALQGYRDLLRRFPAVDLADNAQYGAGECFFAQVAFDSASVEYAKVPANYPKGDRVPAAMYKLSLCQDRLGRAGDARKTLEDLVRLYPNASESQLARDRIGAAKH
jgi:tol-pal system protein YbgF